jgi:hypothetical protein
MKSLFFLLLVALSAVPAGAQSDMTTKLIIANTSVVEIAPDKTDQPFKDLTKLNVTVNGKLAKTFEATDFISPQVIGTYHGITWNIGQNADAEYVLFRTSMGNGACAGGTLYVIAFLEDEVSGEYKNVHISQSLTACLGEYPAFAIIYTKAGTKLDIAGHTLNLDKLDRWVEKEKVIRARPKK